MTRYHQPGAPVDMNVGAGEQVFHWQAFWAQADRPVEGEVAATDADQARIRVRELLRSTMVGWGEPAQVAVFTLDDWATRGT